MPPAMSADAFAPRSVGVIRGVSRRRLSSLFSESVFAMGVLLAQAISSLIVSPSLAVRIESCDPGRTRPRPSPDETVSNLTRRRKAGRLQDGIDRYVPISAHGEC